MIKFCCFISAYICYKAFYVESVQLTTRSMSDWGKESLVENDPKTDRW